MAGSNPNDAVDRQPPHADDDVGLLMRRLRLEAGLTLDALAERVGCSKAQLSLMESGQRTINQAWAHKIERALKIADQRIQSALHWRAIPPAIRAQVQQSQTQSHALAVKLRHALASRDPLKAVRRLVRQSSSRPSRSARVTQPGPRRGGRRAGGVAGGVAGGGGRTNIETPLLLRRQIPLINKVAAGYPTEFTDLDYPAAVADEYVACPDVSDPDAFAARVVGDSMEPEYREGDVVVFSPLLPTPAGSDCFVRLERDNQTTFKRVYFEDAGRTIRLQPLNNAYPPSFVAREDVGGLYAAAYVMRPVAR